MLNWHAVFSNICLDNLRTLNSIVNIVIVMKTVKDRLGNKYVLCSNVMKALISIVSSEKTVTPVYLEFDTLLCRCRIRGIILNRCEHVNNYFIKSITMKKIKIFKSISYFIICLSFICSFQHTSTSQTTLEDMDYWSTWAGETCTGHVWVCATITQ